MKRKILSVFLILVFLVNSMVYAVRGISIYGMIHTPNSVMSIVILAIIIYFLIKIFKSTEKKKWIIWFINILSVALILKWGATFWLYGICM